MRNPASNINDAKTLRLVYPQWQGAGADTVAELLPGVPLDSARRAYAVGSRILEAILPAHNGPTEIVPVSQGDEGLDIEQGIEARAGIIASLAAAQEAISRHDWDRILVLGGECSVSVVPFSILAERYGDDLAVVWIDSHPDVGTPASQYHGFHAMAVSVITGHGDQEIVERLPKVIDPGHVALVGLHASTDDDYGNIPAWGLEVFPPDNLRHSTHPLIEWLLGTGCSRVALHFDVDCLDSDELAIGLGQVPGGLTPAEARRIVADVAEVADIVGLTIAEFIPRDVLAIQQLLDGMPLIDS